MNRWLFKFQHSARNTNCCLVTVTRYKQRWTAGHGGFPAWSLKSKAVWKTQEGFVDFPTCCQFAGELAPHNACQLPWSVQVRKKHMWKLPPNIFLTLAPFPAAYLWAWVAKRVCDLAFLLNIFDSFCLLKLLEKSTMIAVDSNKQWIICSYIVSIGLTSVLWIPNKSACISVMFLLVGNFMEKAICNLVHSHRGIPKSYTNRFQIM